jgi:hypothetical protein
LILPEIVPGRRSRGVTCGTGLGIHGDCPSIAMPKLGRAVLSARVARLLSSSRTTDLSLARCLP